MQNNTKYQSLNIFARILKVQNLFSRKFAQILAKFSTNKVHPSKSRTLTTDEAVYVQKSNTGKKYCLKKIHAFNVR